MQICIPTNFCQLVEFYHNDSISSNDQSPSHTLMNFKEQATRINSKWVVEIYMPKFNLHYQNYDQFIGSQLSVSSDRFIKLYPTQLLNVTVKNQFDIEMSIFMYSQIFDCCYILELVFFFQIVLYCSKRDCKI